MRIDISHPTRCAGFSLAELMVVLLIAGLVTALVVPEFKGTFEEALLRGTARQLITACRTASSQAISLQRAHIVRLDTSSGRYKVEPLPGPRGQASGAAETAGGPERSPGADGTLDARVKITIRPARATEVPEETESLGRRSEVELATPRVDPTPARQSREVLTFYPDGTAEAFEIGLKDQAGFQLFLRINPTTARVQVEERSRE